ncbi:uncharacterized protein LOC106779931 [Vigna radiata var. radiata]|uniref:Uncharacterized protein LOC106779931 n=1 Tax=Vigna radiata var. radiata TaxID=3916 RepID=A0A1S3VZJ0_VIGRR|nr:uncharacterized protein LOC106779931 [Vigna radiata var. radiata]
MELEKQLKLLNKSPIKTINTEFGDIIDCIDIFKQPAFDHPLLKDHKLQRKPNFQNRIEKSNVNNSRLTSIFGLGKDKCPTNTVPIMRITKDDLIREKSLLNDDILVKDLPGVHLAEVSIPPRYGPYYGISGRNAIYNPEVHTKSQISMSHLWIQNGPIEFTNKISTGWHVIPKLYDDYSTRLYASWTTDNFKKTGCYNIRCAGFVQTSQNIYLGAPLGQPSIYGGPTYDFSQSISQDPVTKNWWLHVKRQFIGYFPAKLFTNMSSASEVGWGGRTRTTPRTLSPQMGSGHFPDGDCSHSGYFRKVTIEGVKRIPYGPETFQASSFTDNPKCFGVKYFGFLGPKFGNLIQFGGPGGKCGN